MSKHNAKTLTYRFRDGAGNIIGTWRNTDPLPEWSESARDVITKAVLNMARIAGYAPVNDNNAQSAQ